MLDSRTNLGGWRGIGHVGSEGSDARIGKTKIKRNTVSLRNVHLYCNIFTSIIFTVYNYKRKKCNCKLVGPLLIVRCNIL